MKLKVGYKALVAQAEEKIVSLSPAEANERIGKEGVLLVDVRDVRELKREGKIPEAVHVPRGMLEFWIDPESQYYQKYFDHAKEIIFYCNLGWRSALSTATAQEMGLDKVSHIRGGFDQWVKDIGRVEKVKRNKSQ